MTKIELSKRQIELIEIALSSRASFQENYIKRNMHVSVEEIRRELEELEELRKTHEIFEQEKGAP